MRTLRLVTALAFVLIITAVVQAAPSADRVFPHIAQNQNRFAAVITPHADGCTICTQTCQDPETQEYYPCHCTDYQECGGSTEESGCIAAASCVVAGWSSCVSAPWYAGCKFIFYPGSGGCANC